MKNIQNKTVINLNQNWFFGLGDKALSTDDIVCLPHTVQLTPANSSGCRNYQGKYHYSKIINIPDEYKAKKLFLCFEGAMGAAILYINGKEVKRHYCGYTPFISDIGEYLNYGAENEIFIALDNSDDPTIPPGKPQADLDFSYDGGLYRDVTLTVCEPLYITNPILANEVAGGGMIVHYECVTDESAEVHIKVHIKNEYQESKKFRIKLSLIDRNGFLRCEDYYDGHLKSNGSQHYKLLLLAETPELWSPENPYLYTVKAEIIVDEAEIYSETTEIGIRNFEFSLNDGVIYNGATRRFNGANYHQTWPYIGNGVPTSLIERDLIKLKKAGFENIRSHYPFSTEVVNICNRIGLTLVICNPGWQFCEEGIFLDRAYQNMRDIVRWQRNNPSVLIWEPVLNESKMSYEIQKTFHDIVHEEFPFNPCYTASDYGPTDIAYMNYDPGMLGTWREDYGLIEQMDDTPRPMWVREYGDNPDDFYHQNAAWRAPRGWGDFAMVESVNRMIHKFDTFTEDNTQYIDVYNDNNICGYGIWPGISHNRGYHINPCWGGHLDLFRIPKFSYYFMQSQQDREIAGDILYIASWWTEISHPDVTVYSNAQKVRLYCDDKLVGEQSPDDVNVKHPPFTFKDVKRKFKGRERSTLKAEAIVDGEIVATYSVKAPGIANHLKLYADYEGIDLKADGADIIAVRCYMLDADNGIVPLSCDNHPIMFEIEGEGRIIGDSSIAANPICTEAGVATILVQSTQTAGDIKITAKMLWEQNMAGAIKPAELVIKSK